MNKKTAEELKSILDDMDEYDPSSVGEGKNELRRKIDDLVLQNDPMQRIEKLLGGLTGVDETTEEDRSRILEAFHTAFVENRRVPKP